MVDKIETMLLLLGIVSVLAVIAAKLRFPFPILLVIAGLLIGLAPGLPTLHLDPDIVFLIFLPPLLFSAAWNFSWEHFRANLTPIFGMAVGLVFMTIAAVGYAVHWMIPGVTLATGFVLGAIISPPDAVAASAVLKNLRVPKRLMTILEGESLVNDASGLVAYHFAVLAVVTGTFSAGEASLDFLWMAGCGTAVGLLCGMVVVRMHQTLKDPSVGITLTIITPYVVYLLAEKLESSGVLAVVAAGLYIGNRSWRVLSSESRLMRDTIWTFIDYILNGLVFILIGLQFPIFEEQIDKLYIWQAVLIGVAVTAITIVMRFIWLYPMSRLERYVRLRSIEPQSAITTKGMAVASWAGMRGVVSLATALALPFTTDSGEAFPYRNTIQFVTFVVIFISLVFQGLSLPWVVRKLGVEDSEADDGAINSARDVLLETVIKRVDEEIAQTKDESERRALEIWQKQFVDRLERLHELNTSEEVEPNWDKIRNLLPKLYTEARHKLTQL
ncbi:MAG: Na+/H+ antiporter [Puniceicoccales bacterium]